MLLPPAALPCCTRFGFAGCQPLQLAVRFGHLGRELGDLLAELLAPSDERFDPVDLVALEQADDILDLQRILL